MGLPTDERHEAADPSAEEEDELAPGFIDPENMEGEQVLADLDEDDEAPPEDSDEEEEGGGGDQDMQEEDGPVMLSPEEIGPDDALNVMEGHADAVMQVTWHPKDASLLASGACDDKAFLWKLSGSGPEASVDKKELAPGHTDTVASLQWSADGTYLATGGLDGKVKVWDVAGSPVQTLEGPAEGVEFVTWHPRGPVVLAGCEDFSAWMWNAVTGACMQVFTGHGGSVNCGSFTPDGKAIVTGSVDGSLRAWDPRSGACTFTVQGHPYHEGALTSMDLSADGALVVTGSEDKSARLVSMQSGKVKGAFSGHTDSVECVGFCPALPLVATGSMDGTVMTWDLQSLQNRSTFRHGELAGVVCLKWFPKAPLLVTACLDARLRVWDARTGTCVKELGGHAAGIQDVAVRADEALVATASDDHTLRTFSMSQ